MGRPISSFPDFISLAPDHQRTVEHIAPEFMHYSDFNFTSLYCWGADAALLNGNLVIRLPRYTTRGFLYSLAGTKKMRTTIDTLLSSVHKLDLIPESALAGIRNKGLLVYEDVDSFDYIYDLAALTTLQGGHFKKKRNKLHKFLQQVGNSIDTYTDVLSVDTKDEVLNLFDAWALEREGISAHLRERKALERIYDLRSANILLTIVKLNCKLVGFSITESLPDGFAFCHFEKSVAVHDNIATFLAHQSALALAGRGARLVNWEQDLGLPGLRATKSSYYPSSLLKKYTITKRRMPITVRPRVRIPTERGAAFAAMIVQ